MKIEKIKINSFGNLQEKEIELKEGINIIQGENESGKSTLLKFITTMFYGISKNKRGKEISDYEKYEPWHTEEFSGKLAYTLDNGQTYEIYRDFRKKNPKLYNSAGEDITKEYKIDKNTGSGFFTEQTQIEENTFLNTLVTEQQEVRINKQEQNILVQKIANLAGTGEDNISYKKAIEKLNKKQLEEIGTTRSQGRPYNMVKEELENLENEKKMLECHRDKQYEIEQEEEKIKQEINNDEIKIELLKEIKKIEEKKELEKEKINLIEKIKKENNQKIEELKNKIKKLEENNLTEIKKEENKLNKKNKKYFIILFTIFICSILIFILNNLFLKINFINYIFYFIIPFLLVLFIIEKIYFKNKKIKNKNEKIIKNNLLEINLQIKLLEKNNQEQNEKIKNIEEKINLENYLEKEKIKNKYTEKIKKEEINELIEKKYLLEEMQNHYQKNNLKLHTLLLDKKNILPKLEKLSSIEEKIEELREEEKQLLKDNSSIELAKQILEIAYQKMKENVTPKFTQYLSESVQKITNGNYNKVKMNDEEGLIVEKENGEYISANRLSVGTIDQLYISLRFSMIKELAKENLPILLDEVFAYFDNNRLKNILVYLQENFSDTQILIFTCTNREEKMLENLAIPYHKVNMT